MATAADETLLSWAQQAGARTAGLCIDAGPSGERGVFAAGDLHARAEVLAVPRTLVITDADTRERSAAVRAALDAEFTELRVRERPEMQLMLHLVQMMANRAADDSMAPWLDALPASFETMPLNWPADAIRALLPPSSAAVVQAQLDEVAALRSLLSTVAPDTLAAADRMWTEGARPHDPCAWAYATVRSRAFQITIGGATLAALCPLADLLNHAAGDPKVATNAEWGFEESLDAFVVRTKRAVARGTELCSSYGRKPNAELLLHYGFVVAPPPPPPPEGAETADDADMDAAALLIQEAMRGPSAKTVAAAAVAAVAAAELERASLPLQLSLLSKGTPEEEEAARQRRASLFFSSSSSSGAAADADVAHVAVRAASGDDGTLQALALCRAAVATAEELDLASAEAAPAPAAAAAAAAVGLIAKGSTPAGRGIGRGVSRANELSATRALREAADLALASLPAPDAGADDAAGAAAGVSALARQFAAVVVGSERRVLQTVREACDEALEALAAADAAMAPAVLASAYGLGAQSEAGDSAQVDARLLMCELPGRGRGYVASAHIAAGERLIVEKPLVFKARGDSAAASTALRAEVTARVLASPAHARLLRPPEEYAALPSPLKGVSDAAFARTWAAAAANGFRHVSDDGSELFLLYAAVTILNHSCAPNACLDDSLPQVATHVYAIRDIAPGEEVLICYVVEQLCVAPEIRSAFVRNQFDFRCDCPRCAGAACTADGCPVADADIDAEGSAGGGGGGGAKGGAGAGAARLGADALLVATAGGATEQEVAAARECHKRLVHGVADERGRMIALRLREHDSYAAALAATDEFGKVAAKLAPTHWQRHQVRSLQLLCMLNLPNKAVPALMLAAEHMAAEALLLPRGHLQRLATYRQFKVALSASPPALRPRLIERVKAAFGTLDLRYLEEMANWMRRPPGVAQPSTSAPA